MRSINTQRAHRRIRLAQLYDSVGQTELAKRTDIAPAYLWQMCKGEGDKARNVSDLNARRIEAGAGLPRGWLDSEDPLPDLAPAPSARDGRARQEIEAEQIRAIVIAVCDWAAATSPPAQVRELLGRLQSAHRVLDEAPGPLDEAVEVVARHTPAASGQRSGKS